MICQFCNKPIDLNTENTPTKGHAACTDKAFSSRDPFTIPDTLDVKGVLNREGGSVKIGDLV